MTKGIAMSAGAKKDLLVLHFVLALFKISKTDEIIKDDGIAVRTVKIEYRLNKRIDRAVNKLIDRMQHTTELLMSKHGNDLAKWIRSHLDSKVAPALKSIVAKTINLEMLALWICFSNFAERDKTLIEELKEYTEANQYFRIIEMLGGTEVARLEGELFEESYRIVSILKS